MILCLKCHYKKETGLFRNEFNSFDEYCRSKWGITKTHANRLINSGKIQSNLAPIGANVEALIDSERKTRILSGGDFSTGI